MNFVSRDIELPLSVAGPALSLEQAHIWRSKFVDKCAEAERHLLRLLRATGKGVSPKALLSQKIEALERLVAQGMPSLRPEKIRPLLSRLQPLAAFRSDLVHSTLSVADFDGQRVIVLRSAAEDEASYGWRTITLARLKSCHVELSSIANSLNQEANRLPKEPGFPLSQEMIGARALRRPRASSPPPPRPAAAAGP